MNRRPSWATFRLPACCLPPASGLRPRVRRSRAVPRYGFASTLYWFLLIASLVADATPLAADTIFQTNAQGKQVVIQRNAIVVTQDSSTLVYKHFDLQERRVAKVVLYQGSLPYTAERSAAAARQQIVETWKRFGHRATVVDEGGKSTELFDLYLDFYPPGGRGSLLESVPARTTLPVSIDGGGADEIEFAKIARLEIQGTRLKVTLRSGEVKTGQFLMPTDKPAEARVLGITDHYNPDSAEVFDFSIPLGRLKEIRFE
jgi:hypothetical protein